MSASAFVVGRRSAVTAARAVILIKAKTYITSFPTKRNDAAPVSESPGRNLTEEFACRQDDAENGDQSGPDLVLQAKKRRV